MFLVKHWRLSTFIAGVFFILIQVGYVTFYGKAQALFIAPPESAIEVTVDGAAPFSVEKGGHKKVDVTQGEHQFSIRDTTANTTFSRKVGFHNGGARITIPANAEQCLVMLDVTLNHYKGDKRPPAIRQRITRPEPWTFLENAFLDEKELPDAIGVRNFVGLYRQVPCGEMFRDNDDLLRNVLGYGRPIP
jgi:hypothetical protein